MLRVPVNRDYIRAKNRAAHNIKSHQLEQHFATTLVGVTFHDILELTGWRISSTDYRVKRVQNIKQ